MPETEPVVTTFSSNVDDFNQGVDSAIGRIFSFQGAVLAAGATLGFFAAKAMAKSIRAMSEFETAMAGVEKVTGFADDKLGRISDDLRDVAIRFGISTTQIADFGEAAARAGIRGEEDIASFAETVAKMEVALDGIEGDEVADQFARLLGFIGAAPDEVETVASVINALGNQMPTDAGRIIDATSRMAADFRALGLTAPQILGLSAAASTLRESSARAATRLRRVAQEMMSPQRLEEIGSLFGVTGEQMASLRDQAPIGLMLALAQVLNSNTEAGGKLADVLGTRVVSELRNVGLRNDRVIESLKIANNEWGETQSINEEVAIFLDTLNKKWDTFTATLHDSAIEIGQFLKPAILGILGVFTVIADEFNKLNRATEGLFGAFVFLTGTILGLAIAIGAFQQIFRIAFGTEFRDAMARIGRLSVRVITLVGSVAILGTAWKENWFGIRTAVEAAWNFISPILQRISRFLGLLGEAFGRLDPRLQSFILNVARAAALIASVTVVGRFLIGIFRGLLGPLSTASSRLPQFAGILREVKFLFIDINKFGGVLLRRLFGIGNVFRLIASIGLRLLGVIGLIATVLFVAWRDNIDNFRGFVRKNLQQIVELFNRHFGEVVDEALKTFNLFKKNTERELKIVAGIVGLFLGNLQKIFDVVLGGLKRDWELFGDDLVAILKFFLDVIFGVIKGAIIVIATIFKVFFAVLRGDWSAAWEAIRDSTIEILEGVGSFLEKWITGAAEGFVNLLEDIKTAFTEFGNWLIFGSFIQDTFNAVTNWLKNTWAGKILGALGKIVSDIASEVKRGLNWIDKLGKKSGAGGGGSAVDSGLQRTFGRLSSRLDRPTVGEKVGFFQSGGVVGNTGLAVLHEGETVIPAAQNMGPPPAGISIGRLTIHASSREGGRAAAEGFLDSLHSELKSNNLTTQV